MSDYGQVTVATIGGSCVFMVNGFELSEAIHRPFEFRGQLRYEVATSAKELLGRPASVALHSTEGWSKRSGVVMHASLLRQVEEGVFEYDVHVEEPWGLLRLSRSDRIFERLTASEIATEVLALAGLAPPVVELTRPEPTLEYVTQYEETDLAFVTRLLAENGLCFRASGIHEGEIEVIDDTSHQLAEVTILAFRPDGDALIGAEHRVTTVKHVHRMQTNSVEVRDYSPMAPMAPLVGFAMVEGASPNAERSTHVGLETETEIQLHAARRLAQLRGGVEQVVMESSVPVLPGQIVEIVDHLDSAINRPWLVIASEGRSREAPDRFQLTAVPDDVPYRVKPSQRPRIMSTQSAVVVGDGSSEIYTDALGRIKVAFHWDRRDLRVDCSRWIRFAQPWAGAGRGFTCVPRVGDEVLVSFLNGDPNQPVVVGSVHHAANIPALALPNERSQSILRTCSTPGGDGFNELRFEDQAGDEFVYLHAQKDLNALVLNDVNLEVRGNINFRTRGNSSGGVTGNGTLKIEGDASLEVTGNAKAHALKVTVNSDTDMDLVAGATRWDISANHKVWTGEHIVEADNAFMRASGEIALEANTITLKAGGSSITLNSGGIAITSGGEVSINGSVVKLN